MPGSSCRSLPFQLSVARRTPRGSATPTLTDASLNNGILAVVMVSLVAAVLLTTLAAATIVRPIRRLRSEATALAERRHRLPGAFPDSARRDELGELARALSELTKRLDAYIWETERFAADVSHEFKNPLASIRVAAETVAHSGDSTERQRFLTISNLRAVLQLST